MIRIFNIKRKVEIIIENNEHFSIVPKEYDDLPHVDIELKGINFTQHSRNCKDCNSFIQDISSDSLDWFVEYSNNTYRIDMSNFGSNYNQNLLKTVQSQFFNGTKMRLHFHELQNDIETLTKKLEKAEEMEEYERCCQIRDLLQEIS